MKWFVVSTLLALCYTAYVILSQYILSLSNLSSRTIFVNVIVIAAALCIATYPQELRMPQPTLHYGLLFLVGCCLYLQNYLLQIGTKMPVNMGIIDGLAIGVYLPLMTFLLYICFGETVNLRKKIGIVLACLATYFILV